MKYNYFNRKLFVLQLSCFVFSGSYYYDILPGDSRNGNDDLSAETLVKNLLETNISAEDLIALIDAKFTIQQMSVSLPALCPPANISRLAKALISCSQNV